MDPHNERNGDAFGHNGIVGADAAGMTDPAGGDGEGVVPLAFEDEGLVASALRALNMMRKNRHFCDVVLHSGTVEVPAHRAVLAAASPYLFELFTTDQDRNGPGVNGTSLPLSYKLNGICEKAALRALVDYAYTGKLEVMPQQVQSVYLCAWQLRMDGVVKRCGDHLVSNLSLETCVEVRGLPGLSDKQTSRVDAYIAENFSMLYKSPSVSSLPTVRLEVLYASRADMTSTRHEATALLAVTWLKEQMGFDHVPMSELTARPHLLYVALDRSLQDCAGLPPAREDAPLLQDYRRQTAAAGKTKKNGTALPPLHPMAAVVSSAPESIPAANGRPRLLIYSHDIAERHHTQPDWDIIASDKVGENSFVAVSTLGGRLALLSIALRLCESPLPSPAPLAAPLVLPAAPEPPAPAPREQQEGRLAQMETPRCAHGTAVWDGHIYVCGGYDRVECLKSCEKYDPIQNVWSQLPDMRQARGRFNIAQVGNKLFAVGGSDGHVELDSVEMLEEKSSNSQEQTWSMTASMESSDLSNGSDGESNGHVNGNGINGSNGHQKQNGLSGRRSWCRRAKLPLARSHVAVCGTDDIHDNGSDAGSDGGSAVSGSGVSGRVYCVGGWTGQAGVRDCHVYNVADDTWSEMPPLNTGRYQAGACVWRDTLWVVGGCDSWHCLSTTETFSLATDGDQAWHHGPALTMARRGCGVAVWRGQLVSVGGSDGVSSLKAADVLASPGAAWRALPPMRVARAGVGVAVLHQTLYAVGGFCGKKFHSSIEYLSDPTGEWTTVMTSVSLTDKMAACQIQQITATEEQITEDPVEELNVES